MNINLIDSSPDPFGHNVVYMNALLKIQGTSKIDYFIPSNIGSGMLSIIYHRYNSFFKLLHQVPEQSIAHFLYGDFFYIAPYIGKLESSKRKIIATMHKFPEQRAKQILLKNFCNKLSGIIVHSEFIQEQYFKSGITKNVFLVPYPSFYDYSHIAEKKQLREKYNISPKNAIVISALGGTRYDKGLDILIESFRFISEAIKQKILLNIVGRPEHFDEAYIRESLDKYHINNRLVLKGVSDKEFMENIRITDIMALPYRKSFSGNSGPMTEAMVNEIPLIVPGSSTLENLVKKYDIGLSFHPEDPADLAKKIEVLCTEKHYFRFIKDEGSDIRNFIKSHEMIYSRMI